MANSGKSPANDRKPALPFEFVSQTELSKRNFFYTPYPEYGLKKYDSCMTKRFNFTDHLDEYAK